MGAEFVLQKLPHDRPIPSVRVLEIMIKRQISRVKHARTLPLRFGAAGRQVKDRRIDPVNAVGMVGDKFDGVSRLRLSFPRRAEQQVNISGDAGVLHGRRRRMVDRPAQHGATAGGRGDGMAIGIGHTLVIGDGAERAKGKTRVAEVRLAARPGESSRRGEFCLRVG